MAFTCTINTFDRGLEGKAPSLGLAGERFIARRDTRLLFHFKKSAKGDIKKHDIEKALKDSCNLLQEQYNLFFHMMLLVKQSMKDSENNTRELTKKSVSAAYGQVEAVRSLSRDTQKFLNSVAAVAKGGTGVALAVKRNFFLNIDSLQKYWERSEIRKAYKAEMAAEKLETAKNLTESKALNIEKQKIIAVKDVEEVISKLMIETILFVKILRQAVQNFDLPAKDVGSIFSEVRTMVDNEQKISNQIFNYAKELERALEVSESQLKKAA